MTEREENVPNQTCPKCNGLNVKSIERWEISEFKVEESAIPMWACKEPTCLHRWPRES